jgi:hypothetical protein
LYTLLLYLRFFRVSPCWYILYIFFLINIYSIKIIFILINHIQRYSKILSKSHYENISPKMQSQMNS